MDCLNLFINASILSFLFRLDQRTADKLWASTCPHCGKGKLYWARWRRKLRLPLSVQFPVDFDLRFALCCSAEGCRKRVLPPSVRFPKGSPNLTCTILLAKLLCAGPSKKRIAEITEILAVDERTVRRWHRQWKRAETISPWWQELAGRYLLAGLGIEGLWKLILKRFPLSSRNSLRLILLCKGLWATDWR